MILIIIRMKVFPEKRNELSRHFKVLRGAMNLLREPYEMTFHTVFHPEWMEEM